MDALLCEYAKSYWIVCFKWVNGTALVKKVDLMLNYSSIKLFLKGGGSTCYPGLNSTNEAGEITGKSTTLPIDSFPPRSSLLSLLLHHPQVLKGSKYTLTQQRSPSWVGRWLPWNTIHRIPVSWNSFHTTAVWLDFELLNQENLKDDENDQC